MLQEYSSSPNDDNKPIKNEYSKHVAQCIMTMNLLHTPLYHFPLYIAVNSMDKKKNQ